MKRWALLAAHGIQLGVFGRPACAPFVYRWELPNDDGLPGAHRLGGTGRSMLQGLGGSASALRLFLAVDDQFASGRPGIANIALAHQRLVRKGLAHQSSEQLASDFELLGVGG
ncbi:hypothetical protein XVE_2182, partial [Xanthomonas vesicatoria ATCC 35937]